VAEPPRADDPTLAEFERRWRDRGIVVVVLLIAVVAALALLVVDDAAVDMAPWVALAFLIVGGAYGLSVAAQERRSQRTMRALVTEREKAAASEARVGALEDLQRAARDVLAARDLEEVFDRLLAAARSLTDADSGVVLLRVGDELTVAAGAGAQAPDRGEAFEVDDGLAGTVVHSGEALLIGRGSPWGAATGASSIAAPLRLPDRIVGVLVVTRDGQRTAFGSTDLAIVSLFADHAALAVRNASWLDGERRAGRELRDETVALRDEIDAL
jgi:transcriptional regulator with GAF, ATPase, and Fis domain